LGYVNEIGWVEMTSFRHAVQRWLGRLGENEDRSAEYSYQIYWIKVVREWDNERIEAILGSIDELIALPGFDPNRYKRVYHISGVDDSDHAGASLVALQKVLKTLQKIDNSRGDQE
jgi:hypothetical protein